MDESKPFGADQDLKTSTLVRHRPIQGESNIDFLGESERSLSKQDNISVLLEQKEGQHLLLLCREYTMPRSEKGSRIRGWILKDTRIGPVLFVVVMNNTVSKFKFHLCLKTIPLLG